MLTTLAYKFCNLTSRFLSFSKLKPSGLITRFDDSFYSPFRFPKIQNDDDDDDDNQTTNSKKNTEDNQSALV